VRHRTTFVLVSLALLLLGLAFALARCGEARLAGGAATAPVMKPVEFPRDKQRRLERERAIARRAGQPPPAEPARPAGADRLTRALSSPGKDGAVVVEINAIRHAPLVEKFVACEQARQGDGAGALAQLKDELGVDVTEDVDRVAFDKDVLAVSGFFDGLKLPAELGEGEAVGDTGRLYRVADGSGKAMVVGRAGNDLLFTGFDEAQVRAALDRVEGRAPPGPGLPDGVAGGELYGLVGAALLADLLADANDPMVARLASVVTETRLQMTVDHAAALSLDLAAKSPEEAADLARALGGVVAAARAQALDAGDAELAGLLEQARVDADGGRVAFDLAVPGDDLLRLMGCDAEGRPLSPSLGPR